MAIYWRRGVKTGYYNVMNCTIEIYYQGQWQVAASFEPAPNVMQQGYRSAGRLSYDVFYAGHFLQTGVGTALSSRYPVSFEIHRTPAWPAFLLDILPSGAGRRFWLQQLQLKDGPGADWVLLCKGAGNPVGNLRIREAASTAVTPAAAIHPGFAYEDILQRRDDFIEYAWQHGASVAGSSGAQGDAPKFLLTQDQQQRWHADGSLPDTACSKHWLVKFPKSVRRADVRVLRNEAAYYEVARWFGARTGAALQCENDALFIPRFDRVIHEGGLERLGVESLASLSGVSEFGAATSQNTYCRALAAFCTEPQSELLEFVRRDVLNVALGNTDNHGRNTAVIRYADHRVQLSPLYDFAPMMLDTSGIARLARWENEERFGQPIWAQVGLFLQSLGCDPVAVNALFVELAQKLPQLPEIMLQWGVDAELIKQLSPRMAEVSAHLQEAKL